jgi:hypothetical protein
LERGSDEDCDECYYGTDFSTSTITRLDAQIAADPQLKGRVRLSCQAADDITGLPRGFFDVVVINQILSLG